VVPDLGKMYVERKVTTVMYPVHYLVKYVVMY